MAFCTHSTSRPNAAESASTWPWYSLGTTSGAVMNMIRYGSGLAIPNSMYATPRAASRSTGSSMPSHAWRTWFSREVKWRATTSKISAVLSAKCR